MGYCCVSASSHQIYLEKRMVVSLKICPKIIWQSSATAHDFVQEHFCWKAHHIEHNFSGAFFLYDILNTLLFNN